MIDVKDPKFCGGVILRIEIVAGPLADSPSRIAAVELCDPERSGAARVHNTVHQQIIAVMDPSWRIIHLDTGDLDPLMAQHFLLEALKNLSNSMLTSTKLLGIQTREYLIELQASMAAISRN